MLLWCVHRAWVFFPAVSRCCLFLVCPLHAESSTPIHHWGHRSFRGEKEGWLRRRKNKALRKANEELLQSQFRSFCCYGCWKGRGFKSKAGLLLMSWLPCGSSTMRLFLSLPLSVIFGAFFFTKESLLWHWFCPAIGLGPASQLEEWSFSPYFHSCWND